MNSDYVKQLEEQIEQLTKKLGEAEATVIDQQAVIRAEKNIVNHRKEEVKYYKDAYEEACVIVADMHKAAMGKTCAPRSNPVADVAKLRSMYIRLKEQRHDKHRDRSI